MGRGECNKGMKHLNYGNKGRERSCRLRKSFGFCPKEEENLPTSASKTLLVSLGLVLCLFAVCSSYCVIVLCSAVVTQ